MQQPENPAQSASQNYERTTDTSLPIPKGSVIKEILTTLSQDQQPITTEKTTVLSESVVQKTRQIERAGTSIGAAQKDHARELTAKLSSLKSVVWVDIFLFVFGVASLFYPPLKALLCSVTTTWPFRPAE